jgi:tRNA(Ile)-lysidine synthase TilS/MesJ
MNYSESTIQNVNKQIENVITKNTHIGLSISGGFDSTVLTFIVLNYITTNKLSTKLSIITVPRFDDSVVHSNRVIKHFNDYFKLELSLLVKGDPTLHHSMQVYSGLKQCLLEYDDIVIILGDTKNPEILASDSNAPVRVKSQTTKVFQPFIEYDKTLILQLANYFGILNDVSALTHTCTQSKLLRCTNCWQCRERKWAFDQLNYKDIGNM